jgi:hypothetical protein
MGNADTKAALLPGGGGDGMRTRFDSATAEEKAGRGAEDRSDSAL